MKFKVTEWPIFFVSKLSEKQSLRTNYFCVILNILYYHKKAISNILNSLFHTCMILWNTEMNKTASWG